MSNSDKSKKKRGKQGYLHKSSALCITVYDLHGKPISDTLADEILEIVNEKSLSEGLMLSYTRT